MVTCGLESKKPSQVPEQTFDSKNTKEYSQKKFRRDFNVVGCVLAVTALMQCVAMVVTLMADAIKMWIPRPVQQPVNCCEKSAQPAAGKYSVV